ncbi:NAD(+) synthase [Hydrogenibacillus schlegelii]|nr:NAD(+) synthase [Hydrogenibacillus schlegelii]
MPMDRFRRALEAYRRRVADDAARRAAFIRERVAAAGARGAIVGLSGGLDSAAVAGLLARALGPEGAWGMWIGIESTPAYRERARAVADAFGLRWLDVDLSAALAAFSEALRPVVTLDRRAAGNTKARLRMAALYAVANAEGLLVADTTNRSEAYVGYVTKGGDAVADFNPLLTLTKSEVRILAEHLGVPPAVLAAAPSADLWPGQTDEAELGFGYEALDRFLLTGEGDEAVIRRIRALHAASRHKREPMPFI